MQYRMKTHPLSEEKMSLLLARAPVGVLTTLNADGTPYTTPIHFVWLDGAIYMHGLPKGQKIENIRRCSGACFCVYEMQDLLLDADGKPCDTNTKYESIIAQGHVEQLQDLDRKLSVLQAIVEKYTPHLKGVPLPEPMVNGTAVLKFTCTEITGKYYD